MISQPLDDPAEKILSASPDVNDDERADLYDIFHTSKDSDDLAQKLQVVAAPPDLKKQLYDAKNTAPPAGPVESAAKALTMMSQLDPKILALAETHPKIATAFITAATKESETAQAKADAQAGAKPSSKKSASSTVKADVLPTPPGHALIAASDGGLHHVPVENIDKARAIDPALQVLHVEPEEEPEAPDTEKTRQPAAPKV